MADPTVIIDAEPDWRTPPEIAYGFNTVVQQTQHFREQRRPLFPDVTRSVSGKFVLSTKNAQRLLNVLLYGASKVCCTPIYSEPIFAGSISGSSITAETDLTYFWNIKHCEYLVLLDYLTGESEMLKVGSVSGQVISLAAAIVGTWIAAQTVMYPAIASVLRDVKQLSPTSQIGAFSAEFSEISIGEESGKVWVGLDEQICPEDTPPAT